MNQKNNRFVIQEHTIDTDIHWDLMFESGNTLRSYRLGRPVGEILYAPAGAVKIFDHPLKFLSYEGSVNKGRGRVHIVEAGTYRIVQEEPGFIELALKGRILKGRFVLVCIEENRWQFGPSQEMAAGD